MPKLFFSDRENSKDTLVDTGITYAVFNEIIRTYREFCFSMSQKFPEKCIEKGMVVGFNENKFIDSMICEIPDFPLYYGEIKHTNIIQPITDTSLCYGEIRLLKEDNNFNQCTLVDFIEFCIDNIGDYEKNEFHDYFFHYHLSFIPNGMKNKSKFTKKINQIFQSKNISLKLSSSGLIERILPLELESLIQNNTLINSDAEINNMIHSAIQSINKPKIQERQKAITLLWCAFEKIKNQSQFNTDAQFLTSVAENSSKFYNILSNEINMLTVIGKQFQIIDAKPSQLNNTKHIDYLFYRMMSMISLLLKYT
jgi:hypothetical protein